MLKTLNLYEEENLLKIFEEIHNFIYANDGLSTQSAFDEFIKILFLKLLNEKNDLNLFYITADEYSNNTTFILRIDKLLNFVKNKYKDLFSKEDKLYITNNSLAFIVEKLQNIDFEKSTNDVKGLAFQKFLSSHDKASRGQFFTPQEVINFCIKIIEPQIDDKIIDPTCGSGGFLFSSLKYIEQQNYNLKFFKQKKLFGIDINKDVIKITKLKALLEDVNINNFINLNSIGDINNIFSELNKITEDNDLFDIVLTNPPFGSQGKITDKNILKQYELGYKWIKKGSNYIKTNKLLTSQVPDVLFIERCLQLLKENGKLAIVLPNGILENSSLSYVRYFIKNNCKILSIVKLPDDTFIPYGTGVKTSVLFLEKQSKLQTQDYNIFFSKITKLGYKGNKNATPIYKKDEKGNFIYENGRLILDENYSKIETEYKQFKQGKFQSNEQSFVISNRELEDRFDYNFYSPSLRKNINYLKNMNSIRLTEVAEIVNKKSLILKEDIEVEYIELSDINTYSYEIINSTLLHTSNLPSRASYQIQTGNIITAVAGNSIGSKKHATAYITKEYNNAICTNGFRVIRNIKINPYYLLYFMKTEFFLKQILLYRTGTAIPTISDNDFKNILIKKYSEAKMNELGNKIKEFFNLREESNSILKSLNI